MLESVRCDAYRTLSQRIFCDIELLSLDTMAAMQMVLLVLGD